MRLIRQGTTDIDDSLQSANRQTNQSSFTLPLDVRHEAQCEQVEYANHQHGQQQPAYHRPVLRHATLQQVAHVRVGVHCGRAAVRVGDLYLLTGVVGLVDVAPELRHGGSDE